MGSQSFSGFCISGLLIHLPHAGLIKRSAAALMLMIVLLNACTIPKEASVLKRNVKAWNNAALVLSAWADSPFSGLFLTLRGNGKFQLHSSGLIRSYEAGRWTCSHDTIQLAFVDSRLNTVKNGTAVIDRRFSNLLFYGDSTGVRWTMKIMINQIP